MVRIAAIVPTRNRTRYAINALRSLLDQDCRIDIFVSDNSTSAEDLRQYCRNEPRVTYLRPDRELPMGEHWDWALRQAMPLSDASHFTIHYDRKISKPGSWDRLAHLASGAPGLLISFSLDQIAKYPPPLRIWQAPWTGKLFAVESARLAAMIASGRVKSIGQALPVLSNCLVPRPILASITDRFGDICNSIGGDAAFLSRFLALHDGFLHHDRAQGIIYGTSRSNGLGYMTGKGKDYREFIELAGVDSWLHAAPLPGVDLGYNMLYHEYELVRRETGDQLPTLDQAAILRDLGEDVRWKTDSRLRKRLREMLVEQGWTGPEPPPLPRRRDWTARRYELRTRRRMKALGETPPNICGFAFKNDDEGLMYALRYMRQRQETHEHLEPLQVKEAAA